MPVLPLFDSPADPDAWHRVTAPGGYEWWYFDAEDVAADGSPGGVQVVAIFFEGFVFHPEYLRRYACYRRRPTRNRPPMPGEYPCAYLAVYEGGRVLAQFMTQYRPEAFAASADRPDVQIGPNSLRREDDGAIRLHLAGSPWRLTPRGPQTTTRELSADLVFRPRLSSPPHERPFLSRASSGADHRWVIANPLCAVDGTIRLGGPPGNGAVAREIRFAGRGYHDHNFGAGPIGPGVRRWVWGRVLADDRALTFHCAIPRDGARPDEAHLVEADAAGVRELPLRGVDIDWGRRSGTGLAYPATIRLRTEAKRDVVLDDPRLVDASPFYLRASYRFDGPPPWAAGRALCEVAYPHRLTWPVLGRMIQMSIDVR